ncbi:uncharacterized protein [Macrobrachium rosenbergii]|uniref:uncharacterized protein isoform X2 n=1 Tax=Macrobrachium rosenbergii TaxID=79674 RepID=UPI0034D7A359
MDMDSSYIKEEVVESTSVTLYLKEEPNCEESVGIKEEPIESEETFSQNEDPIEPKQGSSCTVGKEKDDFRLSFKDPAVMQVENRQQCTTYRNYDLALTEQPLQLACGRGERSMNFELLINLVQDRHPIYDPSDPLHRNRDAISALWKDIATEMKCKVSECKEKWQQLRSNFMREKKKLDTHPSGSANVKVRKWVFYDTMVFLTPYVAPRATSSNVPPPLEEINTEIIDTGDAASTAKKKTATKKRVAVSFKVMQMSKSWGSCKRCENKQLVEMKQNQTQIVIFC